MLSNKIIFQNKQTSVKMCCIWDWNLHLLVLLRRMQRILLFFLSSNLGVHLFKGHFTQQKCGSGLGAGATHKTSSANSLRATPRCIVMSLTFRCCRRGRPGRRGRGRIRRRSRGTGTSPAWCRPTWWSRRQTGTASCRSRDLHLLCSCCSLADKSSRSTHYLGGKQYAVNL